MKYLFTLVLFVVMSLMAEAGINDMYVNRKGENGWLFHIFSQKMPSLDKKGGNLEYDFTYTEANDSVALLATLKLEKPLKTNSLIIESCGETKEYPLESLYLEPRGKKFEYRLKAVFPFEEWWKMYTCSSPFIFKYTFGDGSYREIHSYSYGDSKWKSNSRDLMVILNTIKLNVGK